MMGRYVATINVPGYTPEDDDPPLFDTAQEAWEWLADERERDEDEVSPDGPHSVTLDDMRALAQADTEGQDYSKGGQAIFGDNPYYTGEHDLGLVYSVTEVES